MNYLIDTHVFLWSLFSPKKISKKTSKIILDIENNIFVSIISFWEISLKYNLGKIKLNKVLPDELPSYAEKSGYEILNVTAGQVSSFYRLPRLAHKDPFDRMIIWQCIGNQYTLISKDKDLSSYKELGLKIVW